MNLKLFVLLISCGLASVVAVAQSTPLCGQNNLYQSGASGCIWLRASNSNTINITGPQLPTNATGLAIGPAFSYSAPNPTYWTVGSNGNYYYYSGSQWVNTNHSAGGSGFTNPGAGGSVIYNLKSDGQVSVYNGTANATILTTLSGFTGVDAVQDIAADQNDNFYLLKASSPQKLVMFNSLANQTCTYAVTGADHGGGLALSAGKVHIQTNMGSYYIGSLSNGTISFSLVGPIYCQTNDLANCPADAGIFTEISASPSATLSCAVTSINLSSNDLSGNAVYSWGGPGIIGSTSGQSVQVNTAGIYTRTATDCAGISKTSTINIGLYTGSYPINPAQSGTVYCQGAQALTLSVTGLANYQWLPSTGLSSSTGSIVQANPGATITYTINGTLNNCNSQTFITVVSVPLLPPVVSANNPTICNGSASILSAQGAGSFTWLPSNINSTSLSVTPNVSTTYTVVTSDQYGCEAKSYFPISVYQIPVITVSASDPEICRSETSYINSSGADNFIVQPGMNTGSVVSVMPLNTTIYTITGNNWQCTSSSTLMITVNPLPTISISSSKNSICEGETVTITAVGAANYLWNNGGVNASFVITPVKDSLMAVTGTDLKGCSGNGTILQLVSKCSGIADSKGTIKLNIYPNPCKEQFFVHIEINSNDYHVSILNSLGQLVEVKSLIDDGTPISIQSLSPGLYYLVLYAGNEVVGQSRMVVE